MSARLSHVPASSEKWKHRSTIEVSSVSSDPQDLAGFGSSGYRGDMGITGIRVPDAPTPDPAHRYLFRLCEVEIPPNSALKIIGLRQLATIRYYDEANKLPLELEVQSPLWSFPDGNISWHLRWQAEQFGRSRNDSTQRAGTSPNSRGSGTALLYRQLTPTYVPLNGGQPPGNPIQDLGTWRDIRFVWEDNSWDGLDILIAGPGSIALYASVYQPDPSSRPAFPNCSSLRPEDRFVADFPTAKYGRVAGAMVLELFPNGETS